MAEKDNKWMNGIMGVVVGDALGLPVQFQSRKELEENPLTDMIGYGTFNMPEGSWSDDSSLTLATVDSIRNCKGIDCADIMEGFADWLVDGRYTPFGYAYDQGNTCVKAIVHYMKKKEVDTCGVTGEYANGNGALMRIMPVCLWAYEKEKAGEWTVDEVVEQIHKVAGLTHNHLRSHMACGIYYFMVKSILDRKEPCMLQEILQQGMNQAKEFYHQEIENLTQWAYYHRMEHLEEFKNAALHQMKSSGYVVDSLEAAVWCLLNTKSLEECLLKAANLGEDTDTVAAIAGGLAGLYYGYEAIPKNWIEKIQKREWIESMVKEEK